jgi:hypothetical protein
MTVPGVVYLVARGAGIGVYALMVTVNHWGFDLHAWDGDWYLQIAQHGYLGVDRGMTDMYGHRNAWTPMVFFPGYPLAVRIATVVTGGHFIAAGVLVSMLAGVFAAYGVARIARNLSDSRRFEILLVVLFAAMPMSITFSLTYPEALLCALAAWALVGMLEHRWWVAGPCVLVAGYVSPMAAPLIIVAVVAAFRDAHQGRGGWGAPIAGVLAPCGMVGYLLWITASTGSSYFAIQRSAWGNHIDGGVATMRWLWQAISRDTTTYTSLTAILTVGFLVLTVVLIRTRTPWRLWLYTALCVAMAVGTAGIPFDLQRLLLAAFPALIPVAKTLAKQTKPAMLSWTLGVAAFGLWFSAYSLAVWHYSI